MQLFIKNEKGELIATYIDGHLRVNGLFNAEVVAFHLFQLLFILMRRGGGAAYGGPLGQPGTTVVEGDDTTAEDEVFFFS